MGGNFNIARDHSYIKSGRVTGHGNNGSWGPKSCTHRPLSHFLWPTEKKHLGALILSFISCPSPLPRLLLLPASSWSSYTWLQPLPSCSEIISLYPHLFPSCSFSSQLFLHPVPWKVSGTGSEPTRPSFCL